MKLLVCGVPEDIYCRLRHQYAFSVDAAADEEDALSLVGMDYGYDAVIADIRSLTPRRFRRRSYLPLVMLSGMSDVSVRVDLLSQGADHVLTLPLDVRELFATVEAAVRARVNGGSSLIKFGEFALDIKRGVLCQGHKEIPLSHREYDFLHCLVTKRGRVLSNEYLLNCIYGSETNRSVRCVSTHIFKLRSKLGFSCVMTVWGRGYMMPKEDAHAA